MTKKNCVKKNEIKHSIDEVVKASEGILDFCKVNEYDSVLLVYSLIFSLEAITRAYCIPRSDIGEIRRNIHRYMNEIEVYADSIKRKGSKTGSKK